MNGWQSQAAVRSETAYNMGKSKLWIFQHPTNPQTPQFFNEIEVGPPKKQKTESNSWNNFTVDV